MTRWLAESSALFTAVEFHVAVNAGREPLVFRCAWVRSADKNEEAWDTSEDESAEVALWSGLDGCSKEHFPNFGDYMRILDLVEFQPDSHQKRHREIRFCQFYRKAGGTNKDWIFGQGAGHMSVKTFYKLIHKAKTEPDYGSFEGVFDKLENIDIHSQRKS